jgi:hypothetical protein
MVAAAGAAPAATAGGGGGDGSGMGFRWWLPTDTEGLPRGRLVSHFMTTSRCTRTKAVKVQLKAGITNTAEKRLSAAVRWQTVVDAPTCFSVASDAEASQRCQIPRDIQNHMLF